MIDEKVEIELSELIRDSINSHKGELTIYQVVGILQGITFDLLNMEIEDEEES